MKREEPDHPASLTNNNFGCFSSRVGSHLQWNLYQRSMVPSGANPSHQLFGAPGSHISSTVICQGEVRHHNPSQDRQHHCGCQHQQNGGDCITYTFASNQGAMVMVHGKEYPVTGSGLTRSIEFHCRQGVEDLVRQIRMEALPSPLSENQSSVGASLNRPVCKQVVSSTASLYQLETRSTGNSHGCFHSGLVQHSSKALCQPPMESSRQSPISDTQPGGTGISFSGTSMESPILVSTVASDAGNNFQNSAIKIYHHEICQMPEMMQ